MNHLCGYSFLELNILMSTSSRKALVSLISVAYVADDLTCKLAVDGRLLRPW